MGHRAPCTNPVCQGRDLTGGANRLHGLQDKVDLETRQALSRRMGWVIEAEAPTLEHELVKAPIVDESPVGDGPVDDPPMGDPTGEDELLEDPRVADPPEEAHPVNGSPKEDPSGEDEPLEVLPMARTTQ